MPVGMRKTTNVRDPTIASSTRAMSRRDAGEVAISSSCSTEGAGADLESCGISRANASTISGVTASQTVTDTVIALEVNGQRAAQCAVQVREAPIVERSEQGPAEAQRRTATRNEPPTLPRPTCSWGAS